MEKQFAPNFVEQYLIHRLEEQALNFLRDPSNFELASPQTQMEVDYVNIQATEKNLVDQLNKKYGPGSLDPTTGKFTPVEQDQPKEPIQ